MSITHSDPFGRLEANSICAFARIAFAAAVVVVASPSHHAFGQLQTDAEGIEAEAAVADVPAFIAELSPDVVTYLSHVTTLANPFFEGRAPGTAGNEAAAEYIEFWFRQFELDPAFPAAGAGDDAGSVDGAWTSYHQPFSVRGGLEANRQELKFKAPGDDEVVYEAGVDFNAVGMGEGEAEAPLTFVGYGIEEGPAGFETYNSFGDIDLTGRIALLLRFEPSTDEGFSKWQDGPGWTDKAGLSEKMTSVVTRGATGIILVHPPGTHDERADELLTADESFWGRVGVPVVHMRIEAAERLLQSAGAESMRELEKIADSSEPRAFHLGDDVTVTIATELQPRELETTNVGGALRGRGDLADEWIIIGAHYDHIGYGYFGSAAGPGAAGTIHPGADDNASGTSGMLLLAERLSRRYAELPEDASARSILFMGFSAEEGGLQGSRYYTRNPTLGADQINAMLNLDMIGRLREDTLEVSGVGSAEGFEEWLQPVFEECGLEIYSQQTGQGPSDHASFYSVGIPVLFFFTGLHEQYHAPGDVASLINPVGAVRIVNLVERIAIDLATRSERLVFRKAEGNWSRSGLNDVLANDGAVDDEQEPALRPRTRVRLGIRPSYRDDVNGVLVDGVSEDTAASKGGVKAGDLITNWNGAELHSVRDMMPYLRSAKPGDEITLTVSRDGNSIQLTFPLEAIASEN